LRTSETTYLEESFVFYEAIRLRDYFKDVFETKNPLLVVKKLRYYARYIVVCLLLNRRALVVELVDELQTLVDDYVRDFKPADAAAWRLDYEDVRATWKRLALARAKKDGKEAAQCFAQDCSIEDCSTGHGWRGRGGVEDYYADLFKAFPDANFETLDLFGVVQEVLLTATHKGQWQSYRASGRTFHCRLVILMPWDAQSRLFAGEKIYLDSDDVFQQQHGS
ncbi:uncharacterized protein ACA1_336440, partial [Acanthamoeba castellanii str. Neff]